MTLYAEHEVDIRTSLLDEGDGCFVLARMILWSDGHLCRVVDHLVLQRRKLGFSHVVICNVIDLKLRKTT
jgi:hypothetical protein